jgi:hypothetical protein
MELLDRIEARLEDTSPRYRRVALPGSIKRGSGPFLVLPVAPAAADAVIE